MTTLFKSPFFVFSAITVSLVNPPVSFAQGEVGNHLSNGSHAFWCGANTYKGKHAVLIDSELAEGYAVNQPEWKQVPLKGETLEEKADDFRSRLAKFDPERAQQSFIFALQVIADLYGIDSIKNEAHRKLVSADPARRLAAPLEIDPVTGKPKEVLWIAPDFHIRTYPTGCPPVPVVSQLREPDPKKPFLKVDMEKFNSLSFDDRVKSFYHEAFLPEAKRRLPASASKNDFDTDEVSLFVGRIGSAGFEKMNVCNYLELFQIEIKYVDRLGLSQYVFLTKTADPKTKQMRFDVSCKDGILLKASEVLLQTKEGDLPLGEVTLNDQHLIVSAKVVDLRYRAPFYGTIWELNWGNYVLEQLGPDSFLLDHRKLVQINPNESKLIWEDGYFLASHERGTLNRKIELDEMLQTESLFECVRTTVQQFKGGESYLKRALAYLKLGRSAIQKHDLATLAQANALCTNENRESVRGSVNRRQRINHDYQFIYGGGKQKRRKKMKVEQDQFIAAAMIEDGLDPKSDLDQKLVLIVRQFLNRHGSCQSNWNFKAEGAAIVGLYAGVTFLDCHLEDGRHGIYFGPNVGIELVKFGGEVRVQGAEKDMTYFMRFSGNDRKFAFASTYDGSLKFSFMAFLYGRQQEADLFGAGASVGASVGGSSLDFWVKTKSLGNDFTYYWAQLLESAR